MTATTHLPDRHRNFAWKVPVRVATTANGTLATAYENGDTLDGVVLATGNRILLKNQSTGADNGIYTVNASGAPTRALDFDIQDEILGSVVIVTNGTTNADTAWLCTTNATITVGTTALVFAAFGTGTDLSAIDFLVGTASGLLSGEITVGTTPGGELGGTWPSPTVDPTHAGSTHTASMVPYLIASGETYTVPINKQALFEMVIDNQGALVVDGYLIMVT